MFVILLLNVGFSSVFGFFCVIGSVDLIATGQFQEGEMEGTGRVMFGADLHMSNGMLDYFVHLYLMVTYVVNITLLNSHSSYSILLYLSITLASH